MIAALFTGCLALTALGTLVARSRRPVLRLHPDEAPLLAQLGLTAPEAFLRLAATTVSGHPDRCVGRLVLTDAAGHEHPFYLKREHRVPWKERLANWWAGFGWSSKSVREADVLAKLEGSDLGPRWLAAGEDGNGRAFLLLHDEHDLRDLRAVLTEASSRQRRRIARWLGSELARLHDLGFNHRDLYAHHLLLDPATERLCLLDWQRSRRQRIVPWDCRWHDLAALAATLPVDLASPRDRLALLRSYLRASEQPLPDIREALQRIREHEQRLLRHRHIRLKRESPLGAVRQALHTVEPHVLEVTPEFRALCPTLPDWLRFEGVSDVSRQWVFLAPGREAQLVRRRSRIPWHERWRSRRRWTSPELAQAPLLFRLERQGLLAPRLLALGQRDEDRYRTSLLLIEAPTHDGSLRERLLRERCPHRRRTLLDATGDWLRRLHAAHCFFDRTTGDCPLAVRVDNSPKRQRGKLTLAGASGCNREGVPAAVQLVLLNAEVLHHRRRSGWADQVCDLRLLCRELRAARCSRSEQLRVLRAYLGEQAREPALLRKMVEAIAGKQ
jgi:tRNA A-37 threonylcarbamoyl transferase component Bud32